MEPEEIKKKLAELMAKMKTVEKGKTTKITPEQLVEKKAHYAAAAKALDEFNQLVNNKDVEGLINVLKHTKTRYLAIYAIDSLHKIGDEKAIAPLIDEALKGNHGISAREAAVWALGDMGKHNVVEPLIYMMGKGSLVRRAAAQALGKIKDDRAVEPLNMVMGDEDEDQEVRQEAAEALGKIATTEAITKIIGFLDSDISKKALSVLKKVGKPTVEHHIIALGTVIEDKAIIALGQIGESAKAATTPLIKILETTSNKDDPTCSLRESILTALALVKDPDAVEPLIKAIKYAVSHGDDDYAVQNFIIFALGDIGDKRATKPLIRLMLQNSEVRGTAAAALGKIGDNEAVEPLVSVLRNNRENKWVRDNAAWALLQLDEKQTALPLLSYLKNDYKHNFNFLKGVKFPSEIQNEVSEE